MLVADRLAQRRPDIRHASLPPGKVPALTSRKPRGCQVCRVNALDETVVRLGAVRKAFGEVAALDGVDLEIGAGESVAVMGPSGSGKSTLLNMVAGLDRPTSGTVEVNGEDLTGMGEAALARYRRRRIGMVFQFFNLLDDLPVLENVALAGRLAGVPGRKARARAVELLDELGIAARRDAYPAVLSGGERQRVGVARALMNRPALLLADEPTGALDSGTGEQVAGLLLDLNRRGQTLLLVTHDEALATRCATRLVEFRDGRIVREAALERSEPWAAR
ncbi:ABC transporter ATP-binding protein [Actinomadura geliboluensis]|uniref:ABC transporter ATP-binding protein n=1 Tax=Actinomadura geliboluensis TaxID=882440 RepID=A0A5S4GRD9_9ACTN|nr:ABC transporter ATP-binding protein [Actinomadura geliboluensis]